MTDTKPAGSAQADLWNGPAGQAWVELHAALDGMFKPIEALLVREASAAAARRPLDIGCGTGGTTLAVAGALGADARCTGIDISEPMLAAARSRAEQAGLPVTFIRADAQTHPFDPGSFDLILSRFGVMFFDDPVQAFSNLRRAGTAGAGLRVVAWRSSAENPFMTTAERAAAPLLPDLPPRQPNAPGQFAFADRDRVGRILKEAGWQGVTIEPIDSPCTLSEAYLLLYISRMGPVGQMLRTMAEPTRSRVIGTIRPAFDAYVRDGEARFTAACWMISAEGRAA